MKTKRKPGRPANRKAVDQDALLQLCMEIFAEKGFEGTSINYIAGQAQVNDSLLHYHFGNKEQLGKNTKEQLWKKTVEHCAQALIAEFKASLSMHKDLKGISLMKVLVRKSVILNAKYPAFYRLMVHELGSDGTRSEWLAREILRPMQTLYEQTIQEEQAAGRLKNMPLSNMMILTLGAIHGWFNYSYLMKNQFNLDISDPEKIEQYTDTIIETLFHGWVLDED